LDHSDCVPSTNIHCPLGRYRRLHSASGDPCPACPAGKYGTQSSVGKCAQCMPGLYQSMLAQTSCMSCPSGKHQEFQGKSACVQATASEIVCNAGQHVQIVFLYAHCEKCEPGMFQPDSKTTVRECTQCPAGKFMLSSGAGHCDLYHKSEFVWYSKMKKVSSHKTT
jgi:hypothetical protein